MKYLTVGTGAAPREVQVTVHSAAKTQEQGAYCTALAYSKLAPHR